MASISSLRSMACVSLVLALVPLSAGAQNYEMFEVQRVSPIVGSTIDIGMAMYEHNQLFHSDAPYGGQVLYMGTGQYSGQYQWVMGPTTFSDIGDRPADAAHAADWANRVAANAEIHDVEYWVRVEELSYTPEGMATGTRPISIVRRFEVTDDALFRQVQQKVMEVNASVGAGNPRAMYQRRFVAADNWSWVAVTGYESYAALDDGPDGSFQEAFRALYGDGAWDDFLEDAENSISARDDVLRELITGM